MLLDIVSLPRDICRYDPSRRQPDSCRLPLCRIGLLGLGDPDLDAHPFELRSFDIV